MYLNITLNVSAIALFSITVEISFPFIELIATVLFQIISGELEPDEGEVIWGTTITHTYFPKDNNYLFETDDSITDWLRQYSKDPDETYVRSFLGRMLFSGEEALKEIEKEHILKVLAAVDNNKTKAAEILQIDRKTLRQKLL